MNSVTLSLNFLSAPASRRSITRAVWPFLKGSKSASDGFWKIAQCGRYYEWIIYWGIKELLLQKTKKRLKHMNTDSVSTRTLSSDSFLRQAHVFSRSLILAAGPIPSWVHNKTNKLREKKIVMFEASIASLRMSRVQEHTYFSPWLPLQLLRESTSVLLVMASAV